MRQALTLAIAALQGALTYVDDAAAVQPDNPTDPSGADDSKRLAEAKQAGYLKAADGRVEDALRHLKPDFGPAFSRAMTAPPPGEITAPPAPPPVETPPVVTAPTEAGTVPPTDPAADAMAPGGSPPPV